MTHATIVNQCMQVYEWMNSLEYRKIESQLCTRWSRDLSHEIWVTRSWQSNQCMSKSLDDNVIEQSLCIENVYQNDSIVQLMNMIRSLLVNDFYVINIEQRLIIFVDDIFDWIEKKVFWFKDRLYLSKTFRIQIIQRNHDDFLIDHFDAKKTLKFVNRKYYWLN